MTVSDRPQLSVVAPCFNEEGVLPEFVKRVGAVLDKVGGSAEIVLVDDGSRDGTWSTIGTAAARDPRVVAPRDDVDLATQAKERLSLPREVRPQDLRGADELGLLRVDGAEDDRDFAAPDPCRTICVQLRPSYSRRKAGFSIGEAKPKTQEDHR